ncbi:TfoX/Sxy family protein [uncultured Alistipes sp.]|jgi:tfoX C-terminal domain-containing protein|uniref:TfoX/Sxy family protein n=1 Tax=uncultured Alistipes sp. TaxID=538949 RepID=UPI0025D61D5C|nr:TfoX/Sxy family protein [uncultured Alistipes sp.]
MKKSNPDNAHMLTALPNVGKVLAQRLMEVGIQTPEELMAAGTENAFLRLKAIDEGACINELMALEGAIQGVRWHSLDEKTRERLRIFFRQTKLK